MNRANVRKLLSTYIETPIANFLLKLGVSANTITLSGLFVAIASSYLLANGQLTSGGIVLLISGFFDMLDGALARLSNKSTSFGALLDSMVDRISEGAILFGLLIFFITTSSKYDSAFENIVGPGLVYLALLNSYLVSYARSRVEGLGYTTKVGIMTRPERVIVLVVGIIVGGLWWLPAISVSLGLIVILSAITTIHRILDSRKSLVEIDSNKNLSGDI